MSQSYNIVELTTTTDSEELAQEMARRLVDSKMAACVQVFGPICSVYRWNDELCQSTEYRCTAKSIKRHVDALIALITSLHSYEVPEILVVDVSATSDSYGQWIVQQVDQAAGGQK
ncbi:MAG: divalent-cation tolerance protein CutA [Planctomycetales bacterium]|nr:divalent-cation tolerance protein CutA [Planctomycetales bacterium]